MPEVSDMWVLLEIGFQFLSALITDWPGRLILRRFSPRTNPADHPFLIGVLNAVFWFAVIITVIVLISQ